MMSEIRQKLGALALIALLSGCAESGFPDATGEGQIRGIAAISDAPLFVFRIEELTIDSADYRGVAGFATYDDLTYNFNFDITVPGELEPTRIATQFVNVVDGMEHTLIITGSVDNPTVILWEDETREWAGTETVFEPVFANFAASLGTVDVYLHSQGTTPVLGNEIGTLAPGERLLPGDTEAGSYEVVFTAAGDPSTILYTSDLINATVQVRPVFALFDPDPSNTAPAAMNIINESGQSTPVPDPGFPGQFRFYHAATTVENVDLYLDEDFAAPIFSDVAFGDVTAYFDTPSLTPILTATAVGNSGAVINEGTLVVTPGNRLTVILAGDSADPAYDFLNDDARPLSTFPVIRIAVFGVNQDFTNVYLLDPGTEITEDTPLAFAGIPPGTDTGYFGQAADSYEIAITELGEIVSTAPPVTFDAADGDIVDIAILDTTDPAVFEIDVYSRQ